MLSFILNAFDYLWIKVISPDMLDDRDARDSVRALLIVQALNIMGFRPPGGVDYKILAQGGSIAGFSDFRKIWSN